ncbi:hypothetical protein EDB85DRAFT_825289 [Lactarius pseudohatsudake]|nr:hypothetical protein EDB85DRAFT_825289 [Lactarius pseudohatsudake]
MVHDRLGSPSLFVQYIDVRTAHIVSTQSTVHPLACIERLARPTTRHFTHHASCVTSCVAFPSGLLSASQNTKTPFTVNESLHAQRYRRHRVMPVGNISPKSHTHAYSIYERVHKVPGTLPRMMLASIPRASRMDAETLCASIGLHEDHTSQCAPPCISPEIDHQAEGYGWRCAPSCRICVCVYLCDRSSLFTRRSRSLAAAGPVACVD